jgi:DNA-binding NtrC family response regulator
MSGQNQETLPKEKSQEALDEARLQYEKMYYELKRRTSSNVAKIWAPRIKQHNKEVTDLFEKKLENAITEAHHEEKPFSHQEYLKLVKSYWKELYIFEVF